MFKSHYEMREPTKSAAAAEATKPSAVDEERCPICSEDLDVNADRFVRSCCYKCVCKRCYESSGGFLCPLCRCPRPEDDEETLMNIRRHVKNDNVVAMSYLASYYANGKHGLEKSHKKALWLYQRAASRGDRDAMGRLGWLYYAGQGVKIDKKKAIEYYRMAAERGDAPARHNLGCCVRDGDGVVQDYVEAVRLYRLAADQGYTNAESE